MPIPKNVEGYLKKANKKFDQISHKTVYTAYDLAQTLKKELKDIAKTLLIKADKVYVLAVVPASMRIDIKKLKKVLKAKDVSIPKENVMVKVFKIKLGAITAFGKLHKVETVVDKSLLKAKDVILQAGSFTDSIRMKAKDFIEMEEAKLANFAQGAGYKAPKKKNPKTAKKKPVKKSSTKISASRKKTTGKK